jgi:hypothetical protein
MPGSAGGKKQEMRTPSMGNFDDLIINVLELLASEGGIILHRKYEFFYGAWFAMD